MLFDTHAHLNDNTFSDDRGEVISRAREKGVSFILNVGFNRETINHTLKLVDEYEFIYASIGWHPQDAKDFTEKDLEWLKSLATTHPKIKAIGEMGLDYHWDTSPRDVQKDVFRQQIQLAKDVNLPIVIHDREAHEDVLHILKEEQAQQVGGIMHCFGGGIDMAEQCLEMNFYISFGGPVTFKNAKLPKEVVAQVPLERLLIETDSPYLAPHPYRGKRNESSYVTYVAHAIADIKGVSYEDVCRITTNNACNLLQI